MFLGWQAMPAFFQAWSGLAGALRTGRSPFEVVHGSDLHAYFTSHPGDAASYETAMGSTVEDFEEFAESVDLSERSTVVCVGGASGIELVPILARWPNLRGVLTDLPDALINAADVLAAHGITDRVTVVPGDARTAAPPGDVYVLSTVLRCLSEPDAVAMLSACRAPRCQPPSFTSSRCPCPTVTRSTRMPPPISRPGSSTAAPTARSANGTESITPPGGMT
jgi:hypothetical protein